MSPIKGIKQKENTGTEVKEFKEVVIRTELKHFFIDGDRVLGLPLRKKKNKE